MGTEHSFAKKVALIIQAFYNLSESSLPLW
jgi:hypothetical protein